MKLEQGVGESVKPMSDQEILTSSDGSHSQRLFFRRLVHWVINKCTSKKEGEIHSLKVWEIID